MVVFTSLADYSEQNLMKAGNMEKKTDGQKHERGLWFHSHTGTVLRTVVFTSLVDYSEQNLTKAGNMGVVLLNNGQVDIFSLLLHVLNL